LIFYVGFREGTQNHVGKASSYPSLCRGESTPKKCCFHALIFFSYFAGVRKKIQCPNDGNIVFSILLKHLLNFNFSFLFLFFWNILRWSSLVPSLPSAAPRANLDAWGLVFNIWILQALGLEYPKPFVPKQHGFPEVRLQVAPWGWFDSKEVWAAYMRRRRQFVGHESGRARIFPLFLGVGFVPSFQSDLNPRCWWFYHPANLPHWFGWITNNMTEPKIATVKICSFGEFSAKQCPCSSLRWLPEFVHPDWCFHSTYCWWTTSCTTKDDDHPIICRVLTIPGGWPWDSFHSTVCLQPPRSRCWKMLAKCRSETTGGCRSSKLGLPHPPENKGQLVENEGKPKIFRTQKVETQPS